MKLTNKKYFLSFIEEFWPKQIVAHLGRVEVYDETSKTPYAQEEIRFVFENSEEYYKIREEWDFKNVNEEELSKLKRILEKYIKKTKIKKELKMNPYEIVDGKLKFTKNNVKLYLDYAIKQWRKKRKSGSKIAKYYIDAFQSVRVSLFGELLPKE